MAASKTAGPKVGAIVDEDAGTVSVTVEHDGKTLIVAQKDLRGAISNSPSDAGDGNNGDDGEGS